MSCTNRKISEMPFAQCLSGKELIPIVQNGENKVITLDRISHGHCGEEKKPCNPCEEWNPHWNPCDKGPWDVNPWGPKPFEDDLVKKAFSKATIAQADSELALTKIQELNSALERLRTDNFELSTRLADLERRLVVVENKVNQNNG